MDEIEDDNESMQDERVALMSIYNSQELKLKGDSAGVFVGHVEFPGGCVRLCIPDDSSVPNSLKHLCVKNKNGVYYNIKHFPPILLHFDCPSNYPSNSAPSITLSCSWISNEDLERVKGKLLSEWEDMKDVILFSWTSFLVNDIWEELEFPTEIHCLNFPSINERLQEICIYDYERRIHVFKQSPHKCNVCFEEFKGSLTIQFLPCEHVFCKICMKSYFEVLINSGDVSNMTCPEGECKSIALPTQIKELIDQELYEKYEKFLLQRTLDQMEDVVRCPRKFCQMAVLKDGNSNMAECSGCNFIFCILCDRTWHGVEKCELRSKKHLEMYKIWQSADEGGRAALYNKYGRAKILRIVADVESAEWLKENSKPCPSCDTPIQLGVGCNKVLCTSCQKYMCWLCGQSISKEDPYSHFRPGGPCENRLFENTIDHEVDNDEFFEFDDDDWIVFDENIIEL